MRFLSQIYSISSGTRKYRKIKALQFYAKLRQNLSANKQQSKRFQSYSRVNEISVGGRSSNNVSTKTNQNETNNLQLKTKAIKKNKLKETSRQTTNESKNKQDQNHSSDKCKSDFLSDDQREQIKQDYSRYQLTLKNGDILLFLPNNQKPIFEPPIHFGLQLANLFVKRMVVKGEFWFCALLGEVRMNGFRMAGRKQVSDKQKLWMHKVSSLQKNSLLCFDTTTTQQESSSVISIQKEMLLEIVNHNVILIAGKRDCDKIIDLICENFSEISNRFDSGYQNILYLQSNKNQQSIPFQISNVIASARDFHSIQNYITWTPQQEAFLHEIKHIQSLNKECSSLLVCGEKNSGKSIFSLYSVNVMLDRFKTVCVLDTDLGQSLFHFPGTINLFSVNQNDIVISNLTRPSFIKPVLSILIGEYSPQYYIQNYIAAINKCFHFYQEFFRECPLVVNTHGYTANVGELLLYQILDIIQPSFIAQMSSNEKLYSHLNNYVTRASRLRLLPNSIEQSSNERKKMLVVDLSRNDLATNALKVNEAKRHRKDDLILSYLTNKMDPQMRENDQNMSRTMCSPQSALVKKYFAQTSQYLSLCLESPLEASVQQLRFFSLDLHQEIKGSTSEIAAHFNSSLVALYDGSYSLNNMTANVIGFAFIRDFDLKNNTLQIITNQNVMQDLHRVVSLVKSSELALSKHFYLHQQTVYAEIAELSYDLQADFTSPRTLVSPFILPKTCGLGNFSFRSRVRN